MNDNRYWLWFRGILFGLVRLTRFLGLCFCRIGFPKREIIFVHAVLNEEVRAFGHTVKELAKKFSNLKVYNRYSEAGERAGNASHGFVTAAYLESLLPSRDADYYFCGPQPFMVGIYHDLIKWGIPASQVHFEFFGPKQDLEKAA